MTTSSLLWKPPAAQLGMVRLRELQIAPTVEQPGSAPAELTLAPPSAFEHTAKMHHGTTSEQTPRNLFASSATSRTLRNFSGDEGMSDACKAVYQNLTELINPLSAKTIIRTLLCNGGAIPESAVDWETVGGSLDKLRKRLMIYSQQNESRVQGVIDKIKERSPIPLASIDEPIDPAPILQPPMGNIRSVSRSGRVAREPNLHPEPVEIRDESDISDARATAGEMAEAIGFTSTQILGLRTVVSELARNIYKYSVEEGYLGKITITYLEGEGSIQVVAEDTGPGIPAALRETIFSGKYKKQSKTGMGVGLNGSKTLILTHKGTFEFDSVVGIGTKITLTMKKK